jgi:hypothetical protein
MTLANRPDHELWDEHFIERYRVEAGLATQGESLAEIGKERLIRVTTNLRIWRDDEPDDSGKPFAWALAEALFNKATEQGK